MDPMQWTMMQSEGATTSSLNQRAKLFSGLPVGIRTRERCRGSWR